MLYGSHGSTLYYVSTTSLFSNNTSKLHSHGLFIVVGCFKMIRYHKFLVSQTGGKKKRICRSFICEWFLLQRVRNLCRESGVTLILFFSNISSSFWNLGSVFIRLYQDVSKKFRKASLFKLTQQKQCKQVLF